VALHKEVLLLKFGYYYVEMEPLKNVKRQAWYLSQAGFERYHFSGGWVFPGWIGFSQWLKRSLAIIRQERC
jgi:hypothetical protein